MQKQLPDRRRAALGCSLARSPSAGYQPGLC